MTTTTTRTAHPTRPPASGPRLRPCPSPSSSDSSPSLHLAEHAANDGTYWFRLEPGLRIAFVGGGGGVVLEQRDVEEHSGRERAHVLLEADGVGGGGGEGAGGFRR